MKYLIDKHNNKIHVGERFWYYDGDLDEDIGATVLDHSDKDSVMIVWDDDDDVDDCVEDIAKWNLHQSDKMLKIGVEKSVQRKFKFG